MLSEAPYKIALFIAAALLLGLAVLLGNAADNHAAPVARPARGRTITRTDRARRHPRRRRRK
ncbi:hypothetical protein [Propioniciclava flava]